MPRKIKHGEREEELAAMRMLKRQYNITKWIGIGLTAIIVGFGTPFRFEERLEYADDKHN